MTNESFFVNRVCGLACVHLEGLFCWEIFPGNFCVAIARRRAELFYTPCTGAGGAPPLQRPFLGGSKGALLGSPGGGPRGSLFELWGRPSAGASVARGFPRDRAAAVAVVAAVFAVSEEDVHVDLVAAEVLLGAICCGVGFDEEVARAGSGVGCDDRVDGGSRCWIEFVRCHVLSVPLSCAILRRCGEVVGPRDLMGNLLPGSGSGRESLGESLVGVDHSEHRAEGFLVDRELRDVEVHVSK